MVVLVAAFAAYLLHGAGEGYIAESLQLLALLLEQQRYMRISLDVSHLAAGFGGGQIDVQPVCSESAKGSQRRNSISRHRG
ncbi:hypothetical protein D3C71_1955070 [compost metagenome]